MHESKHGWAHNRLVSDQVNHSKTFNKTWWTNWTAIHPFPSQKQDEIIEASNKNAQSCHYISRRWRFSSFSLSVLQNKKKGKKGDQLNFIQ